MEMNKKGPNAPYRLSGKMIRIDKEAGFMVGGDNWVEL